jgi:hypothetical protein
MLVPLLLWGGHLLFLYLVVAVGCAVRPEKGLLTLTALWWATAAIALALAFLGGAQYRRLRATHDQQDAGAWGMRSLALKAGPLISLISLVAVLWAALPLLFIAPCT